MKIDVTQAMKNIDGAPIYKPVENTVGCPECGHQFVTMARTGDETEVVDLRHVLIQSLLQVTEDDKQSGDVKFNNYQLANKIHHNNVLDMKAEDVTRLKKLVGKVWGPIIVGQAYEMLDPSTSEE